MKALCSYKFVFCKWQFLGKLQPKAIKNSEAGEQLAIASTFKVEIKLPFSAHLNEITGRNLFENSGFKSKLLIYDEEMNAIELTRERQYE